MKLKYRLRNFFFSCKHSKEIKEICRCQFNLKLIRNEMTKLDKLSRYGILGDSLLEEEHLLFCNQAYYKYKISELKRKFK